MILRDYQMRAVADVKAAWQTDPRVLLALPTGAGKTECAIALADDELAAGRRVLVVVERKTLVVQWRERFLRHGVELVGVLQGENTVGTWMPTLVATAQTLRARGIPENVGLVVLDESHIWHQTHDTVLGACDGARVLGLSATPLREGLGTRFDRLVIGATIRELTDAGYLVPARVFAPNRDQIAGALLQIGVRAGDYAVNELSELMRSKAIVGDVVSNWRARAGDRQTIAFAVDKAHARELADEFALAGVPAAVVVDETSDEERADIFAKFDQGEVKVLTSVGVLGIGFDSPIASCAILARPTLSTMLHIQQAGRVIRPCDGKVDAIILDHACNTHRHGLPIDFVPPADLSLIDRATDKKKKTAERSELVTCKNCECVYPRADDACPECGTPRTVYTKVIVLDGQLVDVTWRDDEVEPEGITPEVVRAFYLEMRGYCVSKGWKSSAAWFKTCERFRLDADFHNPATNRVLPWEWRTMAAPVDPTQETLRWIQNQRRQRYAIERNTRRATA